MSFLLPILLQVPLGFNPFTSGLLIFASAFGQITTKPTMPRLLARFGFRRLLISSSFAVPIALIACGCFRLSTPIALIAVVLMLAGFAQSMQFSCLNTIAFADVEPDRMSHATGLAQVMQQVIFGAGVAVASVILQISMLLRRTNSLEIQDFTIAFLLLAMAAAFATPFYYRLPADAGSDLVRKKPSKASNSESGPVES
jgi:MFS family permease